jgi:hypothetical protein
MTRRGRIYADFFPVVELIATRMTRKKADLRGFFPVVMSIATRTTRIYAEYLKTRFAHF